VLSIAFEFEGLRFLFELLTVASGFLKGEGKEFASGLATSLDEFTGPLCCTGGVGKIAWIRIKLVLYKITTFEVIRGI